MYTFDANNIPLNIETLKEQCGGSNDVAVMILDEFLQQASSDMQAMDSAMSEVNLDAAAKVTHRLKGTAGVLGAIKLHPLCASMEVICKSGNAAEAATKYIELKEEVERCVASIPTAKSLL
ncbi:MAG: Hpt domain-containing protein [Thermoguttaceae bacterium]